MSLLNVGAATRPGLLAVIELGGYPDYSGLYREKGFDPTVVISIRKALAVLKKSRPRVVVAEFNFQSDFRDRTSSLETLLAAMQRMPGTRLVVFYELEYKHQLEKLTSRFEIFETIRFPVNEAQLGECLQRALGEE